MLENEERGKRRILSLFLQYTAWMLENEERGKRRILSLSDIRFIEF